MDICRAENQSQKERAVVKEEADENEKSFPTR
jgi:hypothetical protein